MLRNRAVPPGCLVRRVPQRCTQRLACSAYLCGGGRTYSQESGRYYPATYQAAASRNGTRKTCGSLLAALDVHPRVAMQILRHSRIAVTMEISTPRSPRPPPARRSGSSDSGSTVSGVAVLPCCTGIKKGRSPDRNRPLTWGGVRSSRLALTCEDGALFRGCPQVKRGQPTPRRPRTHLRQTFSRKRGVHLPWSRPGAVAAAGGRPKREYGPH